MGCEISWFAPLCDEDYEFLGVPDPALTSGWEHCRDVALRAEEAGFDNLLLPSNYSTGIDSVAFRPGWPRCCAGCGSWSRSGWGRCGRRSWPASWRRSTRCSAAA